MTRSLTIYEPPVAIELPARLSLLTRLEGELAALEREHRHLAGQVRAFEKRYAPAVGARYEELESLRESLRRGWELLQKAREGQLSESEAEPLASATFRPDSELRRLFRETARQIHPDLALDAEEARRRHEFMAEATRAYRAGDCRRLQWLLEHWRSHAEPVSGWGFAAVLVRAQRRIAWVRYRLGEMRYALGELCSSPMAEMMQKAEHARAQGRNLIGEMRRRVAAELEQARAEREKLLAALDDIDPALALIIKKKAALDG